MGKEIAVRPTADIVRSLLHVDSEKTYALYPRAKLFAVIVATCNLVVAAFSDSFLQNDSSGYYLSLFLFLHSGVYAFLSFSYFLNDAQEILFKAKIFPTNSIGRILFVVVSVIRHPLSIALLASNSFFLIILYRSTMIVAVVAVVLYLSLMLSILTFSSFVFLFLERKRAAASIALFGVIFFAACAIAFLPIFNGGSSLEFIPLVATCVSGIQSAKVFDYAGVALSLGILMAFSFAAVFGGKRFV